jgi:peptide/nickel transport system permease protein
VRDWVRKLLGDPGAMAGALALLLVAVALTAAPWLATRSRMLHGGRTSVALTLTVTAITTVIGVLLGVLAGMRGGLIDGAVMRVVDIVQAVPLIIVAIVAIKLLGGGSGPLVVVLAGLGWTGQARVVRAATLSLREREFIESSRVVGASRLRVACRHIVPNLLRPVVVLATLDIGRILLAVSTLSFLGFGARPPTPEWGSMLADARDKFFVAPRLLIIPGLAIFVVALAANLFGEGLRDAFEPRTAGP